MSSSRLDQEQFGHLSNKLSLQDCRTCGFTWLYQGPLRILMLPRFYTLVSDGFVGLQHRQKGRGIDTVHEMLQIE